MKRFLGLSVILALLSFSSVASADIITIVCPVDTDTYVVPKGADGMGFPINYVVKSFEDWLFVPALLRFDLSPLAGIPGSDVISANFRFFRLDSPGGMMNPHTAPAGTDFTATIHALDDTVALTEDLRPGQSPARGTARGVIDWGNRPGIIGAPFSVSNNTGPNTWAEADITQIVRDWLDGTHPNNGIEFRDDSDADGYVWYWAAQHRTVASGVLHLHPGAGYSPYLSVVIPEPATLILLGTGLLGMLGFKRKRRQV